MRTAHELLFRLRQEAANAILCLSGPRRALEADSPLPQLPDPRAVAAAVQGSPYAEKVVELADRVLAGPILLLGAEIDFSCPVHWRRDPLTGIETGLSYFRRIPYLNADVVGDHKLIWEMNRHQHLVLLAQAFTLSQRPEYLEAVIRHLEHWWRENPFQRGINWTSALEVGFRALSWMWIWHLLGDRFSADFRQRFLSELYRHGLHLEYNLSIYFSPNTHLLGEAVALHALGRLFPKFPRAQRWRRIGNELVAQHMQTKVRQDGSYFEQSTYYQVYALDMFLFHAVLANCSSEYLAGLERMAEFLAAITSSGGSIPFLGDDDGGRFFFPFGDPRRFGSATIAAASALLGRRFTESCPADYDEIGLWWLGPVNAATGVASESRRAPQADPAAAVESHAASQVPGLDLQRSHHFRDSGLIVLRRGNCVVLFDGGPFGSGSAGHSHSDTLSVVVNAGGSEVLVDSGTCNYMDPQWRSFFRGSAAHNTMRVDELNQASESGPFRWVDTPSVSVIEFSTTAGLDRAIAECRYRSFTHRRTVEFHSSRLSITDELHGPPGEHLIEQFWHLAREPQKADADRWLDPGIAELIFPGAVLEKGWRSTAFGTKVPAPVLVVRRRAPLPCTLRAVITLDLS